MKLYGPTSRSHRIAVTAKYCSIRLDYVPVTMGETNKTEEYLKMNPFGKVPMLVCDDANETATEMLLREVQQPHRAFCSSKGRRHIFDE